MSRVAAGWLFPLAAGVAVGVAACSSGGDDPASTVSDAPVSTTLPDEPAPTVAPDEVFTTEPDGAASVESTVGSAPFVTHGEVRTREGDGDVQPVGFTTITARITSAEGEVCNVCLWLADSSDERSQGLMGVTDLGAAAGMAFVWDEPTSGRFYMLGTPSPLSIAWFRADGSFLAEADMEPCLTDDSSTCPRYEPDGDYTVAVEMLQGELDAVGVGLGSSIELFDGTESPTCLVASG